MKKKAKKQKPWKKLSKTTRKALSDLFDFARDGIEDKWMLDDFDSDASFVLLNEVPNEDQDDFMRLVDKARKIGLKYGEALKAFDKANDKCYKDLKKLQQ